MTFPKKNRVAKEKDFQTVWQNGQIYHSDIMFLKIKKNNLNYPRFAIIVSKKISGKAVVRNKIKRQLNEILRQYQNLLPNNSDTVIYTKPLIKTKTYQEVAKIFSALFTHV